MGVDGGDVEAVVVGGEGGEIFRREAEEAGSGAEAGGVFWVVGVFGLFAEVDVGAGELDEAFVEGVVVAGGLEPEVFEHVVGFVVLACVEAGEPAEVARVASFGGGGEGGYEGLDAVGFFHRGMCESEYPARRSARQADPYAMDGRFPDDGRGRGVMATEQALVLVAVLVLLALASVLISAFETAVFSLTAVQIEALKARRASFAVVLSRLSEDPRGFLSAVLLADALVNAPLMLGSIALLEAQRWVALPFWAAALLVFALIVFVCDLMPKLFALGAPLTVVRLGAATFSRLLPLLDPVARFFHSRAERGADFILPKGMQAQRQLTEEEMEMLVELSAEQGALHETESEMISEIIKLGDKTAKDCMTPRVDVFALPDDLTNEEVIAQLRKRRFRRLLVYGETPDDIEGVLDVGAFLRDTSAHYTERLDVPSFVPETMKAIALLKSFLSRPQGLAIVVDEHGGVEGIVTLADLVEEIISDAVPRRDGGLYLESIGDDRLLVNGSARLEDIAEELGVSFEGEGIDTIGGLIFNLNGQLPKAGQELKVAGLRATVRRVSRRRVEEVLLERDVEKEEEGAS